MVLKFFKYTRILSLWVKPESVNFLRKRLLIKVYSVCRLHNFLAFICYHTFMSLYTVFCKITKRIHIFNKKSAAESISCKLITHICDAMPVCSERGRSRFSKKLCLGQVQFPNLPAAEPLVIQINLRVPLQDPHWLPFQAPCMQSCRQESSAIPNGIR